MSEEILKLVINGKAESFCVTADETLATVLREKAGLTGTKIGCDMGTCGCCTVHINGEPRLSCLTLALECQGCEITTIEGLNDAGVHPLSETFATCGGSQCGFCTPGFVMTGAALLEENPDPSIETLREELSGNLCRCTGYIKIYDAVLKAAEKMSGKDQAS
jgi:carbon-monoxide dehydrogenase small subunit